MKTLLRRTRRNPLLDMIVLVGIVLAVLAVLRLLPDPEPVEVSGTARAVDGDSLFVRATEIRLRGIDAPERAQSCIRNGADWPCGAEAARALADRMNGRAVTCEGHERDQHDRLLAVCRTRQGEINHWLVERGWALSYDDYPAAERAARAAKRGIWSGTFMRPREWREENRQGG